MDTPRFNEIITAINNLDQTLKIPSLKGASVRLNKLDKPYYSIGSFNIVFQLVHETKKWAFRVRSNSNEDFKFRFKVITDYLESKNLPYFSKFIYDKNAILINGALVDTTRMEWLEATLLKDYLAKHLSDPNKLEGLANNFLLMFKDLEANQISHGDLQEENILINSEGEIRLTGVDSICTPEIKGAKEFVMGCQGYQHPSRLKGGRASLTADFFSELIIFVSILALKERPDFWDKYKLSETKYLLFTEQDFVNFEESNIYKDLSDLSLKVNRLLEVIKVYLSYLDYTDLKPFYSYLESPEIVEFQSSSTTIVNGGEVTISWNVKNSFEVKLSNGINCTGEKGSIQFKPEKDTELTLTAIGIGTEVKQSIKLKVFPTPIIKSLSIDIPVINSTFNLQIKTPKFPDINLGVDQVSNSIILDNSLTIANNENNLKSLDPKFDLKSIKGYKDL